MSPPDRARPTERVAPDEVVELELVLRYPPSQRQRLAAESDALLAGRRPPAGAAADRSADPADVDAVRSFARGAGLSVRQVDPESRRVTLAGPAAAIEKTFGVALVRPHGDPASRDVEGSVTVPRELEPIVEAVLGLSTKPVARHE